MDAYKILYDETKRKEYDAKLLKEEREAQAKANGNAQNQQYKSSNQNYGSQNSNQGFGQAHNFKGQTAGTYQNKDSTRGKDFENEGFSHEDPNFFKKNRPEYNYEQKTNWSKWRDPETYFL